MKGPPGASSSVQPLCRRMKRVWVCGGSGGASAGRLAVPLLLLKQVHAPLGEPGPPRVSACCWSPPPPSWTGRSGAGWSPSPGRTTSRSTWRRQCCPRRKAEGEEEHFGIRKVKADNCESARVAATSFIRKKAMPVSSESDPA